MLLTTERLSLRPMLQSDAAALFAILGDTQAMRFWQRPAITRLAVAEEMVREQIAASALCRYWTVWRQDDAIGSCDLSFIDLAEKRAETGFLFRRDQWGRGYAAEAMDAVIVHGFGELRLELLTASTHAQNVRARQVLERLGFGLEGLVEGHQPVPGVVMDCAFYALRRPTSRNKASRTQNGA
jgi:[ribosomal protein S5]-alanine N-acetyltransferase